MMLDDYPDVQQILELLADDLSHILGENLVGLYLMGSLAYGDFDRGSSDIDFFAVIKRKLTEAEISGIEEVHDQINSKYPGWLKRIEGSYVPVKMMQSKTPPREARLYVNAGKIWQIPFGDEWLLNLFQIQESGVVLVGKPIEDVIPHVSIDEARNASRNNLISEWKPKLSEPEPFKSKDYDSSHLQTYAILSMCRVLYTFEVGKVVSKRVAADWVRKRYGQWSELVEKAQQWRHGMKLGVQEEALEFIRFAISVVE